MSSNSNASSPTIEGTGSDTRSQASRWKPFGATLKYGLIVFFLASIYAGLFLRYLWWNLSEWLFDIDLICLLAILVLSIRALVRRQWKELVIISAALAVAFLPGFGVTGPADWLLAEGFRIHASPIEKYLSQCKLIEFFENGIKQTVGECEGHSHDDGETVYAVIYDTTGQLLRPVSHRTQDWQRAMSEFYSEKVLNSSESRTRHIYGNFYDVGNTLAEDRGG